MLVALALATSGLCATRAPSLRSPAVLRRAAAPCAAEHVAGETCTGERVTVVGATGYIGKAVVREAVRRGYATTAVARDVAKARGEPKFEGATLVQADVCDPQALSAPGGPFEKGKTDVVISCLASRTGSKKDSFAIDYQATLNCLDAARAAGARHFVLLSAFCVKSAEMGDPSPNPNPNPKPNPHLHPYPHPHPGPDQVTRTRCSSSTPRRTSRRSCASSRT